jgi:hypothetical protein
MGPQIPRSCSANLEPPHRLPMVPSLCHTLLAQLSARSTLGVENQEKPKSAPLPKEVAMCDDMRLPTEKAKPQGSKDKY